MKIIKTIVNGADGKMGSLAAEHISQDSALELVARTGRSDNLADVIQKTKADVVVDFTNSHSVYQNTKLILQSGARPVVGTTGLNATQITELQTLCDSLNLSGIIAPNFSIGAVLMMRFAALAAEYCPDVEIIELHHEKKSDSPSGTAMKTAEMIAKHRKNPVTPGPELTTETIPGARGGVHKDIHIHAVRLPGLVAHQMVLFGGHHETLTIRHDSLNRECFMPGVVMAVKKAPELKGLVYGLENLL